MVRVAIQWLYKEAKYRFQYGQSARPHALVVESACHVPQMRHSTMVSALIPAARSGRLAGPGDSPRRFTSATRTRYLKPNQTMAMTTTVRSVFPNMPPLSPVKDKGSRRVKRLTAAQHRLRRLGEAAIVAVKHKTGQKLQRRPRSLAGQHQNPPGRTPGLGP